MPTNRQIIIEKLLQGHTIAAMGPGQIRLRDPHGNPVMKVTYRTFYRLKRDMLRKRKGVFLVNLSKVRQLHGNSTANKLYKAGAAAKKEQNTPPPVTILQWISLCLRTLFFNQSIFYTCFKAFA